MLIYYVSMNYSWTLIYTLKIADQPVNCIRKSYEWINDVF